MGQLVAPRTLMPTGGIEVQFMRTDGISLAADTFVVTTSAGGWFEIRVPADDAGEVVGDFLIRPSPPVEPFVVSDVRLHTSSVRGHTRLLEPWYVDPYLDYLGELFFRSGGQPIGGATVTFRRLSGVEVVPAEFQVTANAEGRFWLTPVPATAGEVHASLEVYSPAHGRTFAFPSLRLRTVHNPGAVRVLRFGVGAQFYYYGELYWAGSGDPGQPAEGIEVEFRRTGGVAIQPERVVVQSNAVGLFPLSFTLSDPLDSGELVGDLTIRPPAPHPPIVVSGFRLQTHEDDELRHAGTWSVPRP